MLFIVLPVLIFYFAWGLHYIWSRHKGRNEKERFYYQRSYWIIFAAVVFILLTVNLIVNLLSALNG